ncbi:MAG: hypothetical protein QOG31_716 [Thermoplasmata archaeon]|jgi:hypothetical protein|nr:hypothetical protein [Thermoplasmata archaeon]
MRWPLAAAGALVLVAGVYLTLTYKSPMYAVLTVPVAALLVLAGLRPVLRGRRRANCGCCASCACTCGRCGCRKASGAEGHVHRPMP